MAKVIFPLKGEDDEKGFFLSSEAPEYLELEQGGERVSLTCFRKGSIKEELEPLAQQLQAIGHTTLIKEGGEGGHLYVDVK